MQLLPTDIVVSNFVLKHMKPTRDIAMALFDIFDADSKNMRFWLRGEKIESGDVIFDGLMRAHESENMYMFEILYNNTLVGEIGFSSIIQKNKTVYVDYWLRPDMRGHRLIDLLLPTIEDMAFNNLNMNKVVLGIDAENIASRKVAERNQYKLDGVLRENKMWHDGSFHDECEYSKLKSEWIKEKRNA